MDGYPVSYRLVGDVAYERLSAPFAQSCLGLPAVKAYMLATEWLAFPLQAVAGPKRPVRSSSIIELIRSERVASEWKQAALLLAKEGARISRLGENWESSGSTLTLVVSGVPPFRPLLLDVHVGPLQSALSVISWGASPLVAVPSPSVSVSNAGVTAKGIQPSSCRAVG